MLFRRLIIDSCLVPTAFLVKLHEISVEAYVPHAIFVPFVGLTSLRTDAGQSEEERNWKRLFVHLS